MNSRFRSAIGRRCFGRNRGGLFDESVRHDGQKTDRPAKRVVFNSSQQFPDFLPVRPGGGFLFAANSRLAGVAFEIKFSEALL